MNFLKSLYRKFFGIKTGAYHTPLYLDLMEQVNEIQKMLDSHKTRPAYDPSTDENKIMNGEVESYFE